MDDTSSLDELGTQDNSTAIEDSGSADSPSNPDTNSLGTLVTNLSGLARTGRDAYDALANRSVAANPTARTAAAARTDYSKFLPWAIGGLVLVIILGLFVKK